MTSEDRLDKLFDLARSEKPILKSDQIEHIVKSGKKVSAKKIKLGTSGRGLFNPLNLIIMISTIAIVTAFFTIFTGNPDGKPSKAQMEKVQESFFEAPDVANTIESADQIPDVKKKNKKERKSLGIPIFKPDTHLKTEVGELLNSDTLIIGEVLYLTQEELTRLGFLFNENGFFYLNEIEMGYVNFYSDKDPDSKVEGWKSTFGLADQPINQKKDITDFSFYAASMTGTGGGILQEYSSGISSGTRYSKDFYDDLSVPVYFPGRWFSDKSTGDRLIWFHVTEDFFSLLPLKKVAATKNRIELVKKLREIPGNDTTNFVDFDLPGFSKLYW